MRMYKILFGTLGVALTVLLAAAGESLAAETAKLDTGDTAWMLTSTVLVLMVTVSFVDLERIPAIPRAVESVFG